ncbi:MAG: M50 family metallopeptidase [Pelosinus sp.]|nr:M50 family metallopeptidase [Pelosinus sp.]
MQIGKMAGIQIKINNWFILLAILFMFCGLATKLMLAFSAVLWHEFAHIWAASYLGLRIQEIELLPFGGVAYIDGLNETGPHNEIVIAAAGPIASLVLAAVIYGGMSYFSAGQELLCFYLEINIMLALFNLLPALPLDGGRILRSIFYQYVSYERATFLIIRLTKIISVCLLLKTIYDYAFLSMLNLTFLVAAVFLYTTAGAEGKVMAFRRMKVLVGKKAELSQRGIMPTIHYTVLKSIGVQEILRLFGPHYYYIVLVIDEKSQIQGTLTETEIWEGTSQKGIHANIGQFLR